MKNEFKNGKLAVEIDLNNMSISKQEVNISSLMRKPSLEQTMVENPTKKSITKKTSKDSIVGKIYG